MQKQRDRSARSTVISTRKHSPTQNHNHCRLQVVFKKHTTRVSRIITHTLDRQIQPAGYNHRIFGLDSLSEKTTVSAHKRRPALPVAART